MSSSKLAAGGLSRDQIASLRSSENALSALEFAGRDYETTTIFVASCDKVYDAYIDGDDELEANFAKQVKMRFSATPYARLKSESSSPATWSEVKEWISSTFNSNLTAIQLLSRALETCFTKGGDWKAFATSVDSRMLAAQKAVLLQIRKRKQELNSSSNVNDEANRPQVTDIFDFFSASICADRLKSHCSHIHSLMAQEWKTINNAADLACKAEILIAQTGRSSEAYFTHATASAKPSGSQNFSQKPGNNRREPCKYGKDCRNGKAGKCKSWHEACKWGNDCRNSKQGKCALYHSPKKSGATEKSAFIAQEALPIENSSVFVSALK